MSCFNRFPNQIWQLLRQKRQLSNQLSTAWQFHLTIFRTAILLFWGASFIFLHCTFNFSALEIYQFSWLQIFRVVNIIFLLYQCSFHCKVPLTFSHFFALQHFHTLLLSLFSTFYCRVLWCQILFFLHSQFHFCPEVISLLWIANFTFLDLSFSVFALSISLLCIAN